MSFLDQPLTSILVQPKRSIGSISVSVVVNENTTDTLTLTKQPVQQGASITDHAFLEPTVFSATLYYTASFTQSLTQIYQAFQTLQSSRVPFTIVTPKRVYQSMLMTTLSQTTDKATENCLAITISCQQVIIVTVSATQVDRANQKQPGTTGATEQAGQKSSILLQGNNALFTPTTGFSR